MRFILAVLLLFIALPAHAGQAEVREVARMNNCTPKKIDVFKSQLGSSGKVIYQVTCAMPKTTGKDSTPVADTLLIECDQALCELIRPVAPEKK